MCLCIRDRLALVYTCAVTRRSGMVYDIDFSRRLVDIYSDYGVAPRSGTTINKCLCAFHTHAAVRHGVIVLAIDFSLRPAKLLYFTASKHIFDGILDYSKRR